MLDAIFAGRAFAEAVRVSYHDDVHSLWQKFITSPFENNFFSSALAPLIIKWATNA
jgi:hypothetical protein